MVELHVIGEIIKGVNISVPDGLELVCRANLTGLGDDWIPLNQASIHAGGMNSFTAIPSDNGIYMWSHPIDFHFAHQNWDTWPRLEISVGYIRHGSYVPVALGSNSLPLQCGPMRIECLLGGPVLTRIQHLQFFLLHELETTSTDFTTPNGYVELDLSVIRRT